MVQGKLRREEVDDMISRIHKSVNNFSGNTHICICCTCLAFFFLGMALMFGVSPYFGVDYIVFILFALFGMIITPIVGIVLWVSNLRKQTSIV